MSLRKAVFLTTDQITKPYWDLDCCVFYETKDQNTMISELLCVQIESGESVQVAEEAQNAVLGYVGHSGKVSHDVKHSNTRSEP